MYVSRKYKMTTKIIWSNYIIIRLLINLLEAMIELILKRDTVTTTILIKRTILIDSKNNLIAVPNI